MANKKTLTIREYDLPITIHGESEGGYTASCNLWKDCYAQGDTIEEAISEISYVASSLIELYQEEGMKIPLTLNKTSKAESQGFALTFPLIVSSDQYVVS